MPRPRRAAAPAPVESRESSPPETKPSTTTTTKAPTRRRARKDASDDEEQKPKRRRTVKTEDPPKSATRTDVDSLATKLYIGAHVSAAGGVHNAIPNALAIGANAFALFLKSQRKWHSPPLADDARDSFQALSEQHAYSTKHMLPHGSYLVNLAQPDPEKAETAYKCFVDDLNRCAALGITLYNFHPGSAVSGSTRDEAIARIAGHLNRAHKETQPEGDGVAVVTVLENMAKKGNVVGGAWEDLRDIIALVDDKERVGVCIDTCHAFAYGHDMRTKETFAETMRQFDEIVGLKYLRALHLNDSKAAFKSGKDLHANIGTGHLGLRGFHAIMNFPAFSNKPLILETPPERPIGGHKGVVDPSVWADEIKLLEGLIGADPETEAFKGEEERLRELGRKERERVGQMGKGKKGKKDDCDSCDED